MDFPSTKAAAVLSRADGGEPCVMKTAAENGSILVTGEVLPVLKKQEPGLPGGKTKDDWSINAVESAASGAVLPDLVSPPDSSGEPADRKVAKKNGMGFEQKYRSLQEVPINQGLSEQERDESSRSLEDKLAKVIIEKKQLESINISDGNSIAEMRKRCKLAAILLYESVLIRILYGVGDQNEIRNTNEEVRQLLSPLKKKYSVTDIQNLWKSGAMDLEMNEPASELLILTEFDCLLVVPHFSACLNDDLDILRVGIKLKPLLSDFKLFNKCFDHMNDQYHSGKLTGVEFKVASFLFAQYLVSFFFKADRYAYFDIGFFLSEKKYSALKKAKQSYNYFLNDFDKKYKWLVDGRVYEWSDCFVLEAWARLLSSCSFANGLEKKVKKIIGAMFANAKQEQEKFRSACAFSFHMELLDDFDSFRKLAEDNLCCNAMFQTVLIWNNLGYSRWPCKKIINPEYVCESLSSLLATLKTENNVVKTNIGEFFLLWMSDDLERGGDFEISRQLKNERDCRFSYTPDSIGHEEKIHFSRFLSPAFIAYMMKNYTLGNRFIDNYDPKVGKDYFRKLLFALSFVAQREFNSAVLFLAEISSPKVPEKALLGVLYEKLSLTDPEYLGKAEEVLKTVVNNRPELQKNLARVLERRQFFDQALEVWLGYDAFLAKPVHGEEYEKLNFTVSIEHHFVQQKIAELREKTDADVEAQKEGVVDADKVLCEGQEIRKKGKRKKARKQEGKLRLDKKAEQKTELNLDHEGVSGKDTLFHKDTEHTIVGDVTDRCTGQSLNSGFDVQSEGIETMNDEDYEFYPEWQKVGRKNKQADAKSTVKNYWSVSAILTDDCVVAEMRRINNELVHLNQQFLELDMGENNFDKLKRSLECKIHDSRNPVVETHFVQNLEWLLRIKSHHEGVMLVESSKTGKSLMKIRAEIRMEVFHLAKKQIEFLYQCLRSKTPPGEWFSEPDKLNADGLINYLEDKQKLSRFRKQFGGQLSTAAHVMSDIYSSYSSEGSSVSKVMELYDHNPEYYHRLADKFYTLRNRIYPEHKSDII